MSYSPTIQRFIQPDPIGYVDGSSLYDGYFAMKGRLDPSGMDIQDTPNPNSYYADQQIYHTYKTQANHANQTAIVEKFSALMKANGVNVIVKYVNSETNAPALDQAVNDFTDVRNDYGKGRGSIGLFWGHGPSDKVDGKDVVRQASVDVVGNAFSNERWDHLMKSNEKLNQLGPGAHFDEKGISNFSISSCFGKDLNNALGKFRGPLGSDLDGTRTEDELNADMARKLDALSDAIVNMKKNTGLENGINIVIYQQPIDTITENTDKYTAMAIRDIQTNSRTLKNWGDP